MDFTVEVRTLDEVRPHPGADRLDVGRIGGYQTILAKGRHQAGERVLYVPEAALLPAELVAEMGLTGKLAGPGRNRVKAIRLRGVLSPDGVPYAATRSARGSGRRKHRRTAVAPGPPRRHMGRRESRATMRVSQ